MPRLVLLGVGAMNSPRYRPAGLLVSWTGHRVMLDGGGCADPGPLPPARARPPRPPRAGLVTRCRKSQVKVGDKRIGQFDKGLRDRGLRAGHHDPLISWSVARFASSGRNRSRRSTTERATSVSGLPWP